jgi:hypothetical protein
MPFVRSSWVIWNACFLLSLEIQLSETKVVIPFTDLTPHYSCACPYCVIFNYCSYENYTWAINLSSLYLLFEYIVSHKQTLWHSSIGYDLIKGLQLIWKDVPLIGRQKSHLDHLTWTLIIARTWLTSENLSPRIVILSLTACIICFLAL